MVISYLLTDSRLNISTSLPYTFPIISHSAKVWIFCSLGCLRVLHWVSSQCDYFDVIPTALMTLRVFYNVWILTCFISLTLWLMDFQCLLHWVASPAWITWSSPGQFLLLGKTHIGEKAYVCNQCGRGFSRHSFLKQHREFRLEKNHYESLRGKDSSVYSVLRQPQKPHPGEKPCKWMWMNFIQSVHLHGHQRTHTVGSYINIINVGKMSASELIFVHFRGPSLTVIINERLLLVI